jgi:hypothetical protein
MNAPFLRPVGCPVGIEPQVWREAIQTRLEAILDAAHALLAALDEMDSDPDLEDGADNEPSIGGAALCGVNGAETDLELDAADAEPSLGWTDTETSRERYASTFDTDERDDDDPAEENGDLEPDADGEHSLGWGFGVDFVQGYGSLADCTDLEADRS